jgi:transposase
MEGTQEYVNERLDHLGIVAGVCQEIGLAAWLDAQAPGNRQQVSVGTATVAMVLNGLGWSLRQLYLVPQFFATKPIEHLLGPGITAEMLNDDCLGRTLDWLYEHDLTKLFAGIATQARQIFGVKAEHIHVDTTSFAVSGEYAREAGVASGSQATIIAITYGYSRDHREDLKQWMLALATTQEGDIPLFMQPLDGTSLDKASLQAAIIAIQTQLRDMGGEASVYVADNGMYSEANMRRLNQANVKWISRVSQTMAEAQALLEEGSERGPQSADGMTH